MWAAEHVMLLAMRHVGEQWLMALGCGGCADRIEEQLGAHLLGRAATAGWQSKRRKHFAVYLWVLGAMQLARAPAGCPAGQPGWNVQVDVYSRGWSLSSASHRCGLRVGRPVDFMQASQSAVNHCFKSAQIVLESRTLWHCALRYSFQL